VPSLHEQPTQIIRVDTEQSLPQAREPPTAPAPSAAPVVEAPPPPGRRRGPKRG
jgi:hypothetical protein